jgi:hypothetical protein
MGTVDTPCVSLIMAMSMQCKLVAQFLSSALAARGDVINLDDVSVSKEQLTPSAFSSLLLKELPQWEASELRKKLGMESAGGVCLWEATI